MINNGELVILTAGGYEIRKISDNSPVTREPITIEWTAEMAVKQGYPHFMIKEIHEQPETLRNTLRIQDHYLDLLATFLDRANEVFLVACGTSYHACLAASYMFSKLAFLPTYPVYASEFLEQCGKSVNIDSTTLSCEPIRRNRRHYSRSKLCTATCSNRAKLNQRHRLNYDAYFPSLHWHSGRSRNRGCSHQNFHFSAFRFSSTCLKVVKETGQNFSG